MNRPLETGFTLVEVLIALTITAFVSVIAYTSLSGVISGVESLRASSQRSYEINRALMILSRDFREFVARPIRDEFGDYEPALVGGESAEFPLSLTRAGWHNPNRHPRSNLQRINYRMEEQGLWRDAYPVLDRAADTEPQTALLLDDVEYLEVRFLASLQNLEVGRDGEELDTSDWAEDWVAIPGSPAAEMSVPMAVELRLQLADWGEVKRLYVLPPL